MDYWKKITFCFSAFILGLFPLLTGNSKYSDITYFKYATFRTSVVVYLIICFLTLLYVMFDRKKIKVSISLPQVFAFMYAVWALVSAFISSFTFKECWEGFGRHEGLCSVLLYTSIFIVISMTGNHSEYFSRIITASVLIFDFIGVLQLFVKGVIFPKGYFFWNTGFLSTMGNVDMVGGYVALYLPFIFCMYVVRKDTDIWDYLSLASVCFLSMLFAISDVDSGKMGLLAGITVSVVFLIDSKERFSRFCMMLATFVLGLFLKNFLNIDENGINLALRSKTLLFLFTTVVFITLAKIKFSFGWDSKKIHRISGIALGSIIVLVFVYLFNYHGSHRLLHEISEVLHFRLSDEAGSGRGYLWKSALSLVKDSPLFGHGPGTFGEVYEYLDRFTTYTDFAHNDFIQIAVCLGYVGLFFYVGFCASLIVRAFVKVKENKYMIVYITACISYLVHTFFSFSIAFTSPEFWVMAAIMECIIRNEYGKVGN